MICPHCELDTPATEKTCLHCDGSLDVMFDAVREAEGGRDEARARVRVEANAHAWLLGAALAFLFVVAARWTLLTEPPLHLVEPAVEVRGADLGPEVPALPLDLPPVVIPQGG